jgi:hypothetical protein
MLVNPLPVNYPQFTNSVQINPPKRMPFRFRRMNSMAIPSYQEERDTCIWETTLAVQQGRILFFAGKLRRFCCGFEITPSYQATKRLQKITLQNQKSLKTSTCARIQNKISSGSEAATNRQQVAALLLLPWLCRRAG